MTQKQLHGTLRALRKSLPTDIPVKVVRRRMEYQLHGYTKRMPKHYLVVLNNRLSASRQLETLLHEYAHCLAWTEQECSGEPRDHCEAWGAAYASVWALIFDDEEPMAKRRKKPSPKPSPGY